jgi:hypothetical protein
MPTTTCPDCGNEVSTEAAACPKCGRPSARRAPTDERIYYDDQDGISVSNRKIVVHGATYSTANVSSVSKGVKPAQFGCGVPIIVAATITLVVAGMVWIGNGFSSDLAAFLILGAVGLGVGVLVNRRFPSRAQYHVVLSMTSGDKQAVTSPDQALVDRIIAAISDAITHQ